MISAKTCPTGASSFWTTRREASLNWLALGMLLAAWNASSNEPPRPAALRGYSQVSVRAVSRAAASVTQLSSPRL